MCGGGGRGYKGLALLSLFIVLLIPLFSPGGTFMKLFCFFLVKASEALF